MSSGDRTAQKHLLDCWNCGASFESGAFGTPSGPGYSEACPRCGTEFSTPATQRENFASVAESGDKMPRYTLQKDEVRRRLPGVDRILDEDIRDEVLRLSADAPAYFWRVPASTSDYHHPACRDMHGLWAHTLMLVTAIGRLSESWVEQGRITADERDYALAAAYLHDQRKNGEHGDFEGSSTSDHDIGMAKVVERDSNLPNEVAGAIHSHMGPWYDGAEPMTPVEKLVHDADMIASTENVSVGIPKPIPEELKELNVPEASL